MSSFDVEQVPRALLIGVGDLTIRLGHILANLNTPIRLIIGSRSLERATRFANLIKLSATNLGLMRDVEAAALNLADLERTAADLVRLKPDLIFMGASLQAARAIMDLPEPLFRQLDEAQLGPWLPMHLTLVHELMQARRAAGCTARVVNGAYPDAVGPALASVNLAPDLGIGNVGNVVPGITWAVANQFGVAPAEVGIKLVGHHYFSHHVHRFGEADNIPYALDARVGGEARPVDLSDAFAQLSSNLRRQGGKDGQQLTATSAARVIVALLSEQPQSLHAPAPGGLVGGFPVRVSRAGVDLDLPEGLDLSEAVSVNQRCQTLDGIAAITPGGTVRFTEERMDVMRRMLGYHCSEFAVADARLVATDLAKSYEAFLGRQGLTR